MRRSARIGETSMYRIGIDLGGTHIAAGIVDDEDRIVALKSVPTVSKNGVAPLLDDIASCVRDAAADGGLTVADCAVNLIAVVFLGVMACRYHYARHTIKFAYGKG